MSSITRVINSNIYDFIQSIATQFDQKKFPGSSVPALILDPKKDGLKVPIKELVKPSNNPTNSSGKETDTWYFKETSRTSIFVGNFLRKQVATTLPAEMAGEIASNADNFSQWVVILGLTDPKIKMKQAALDQSATSLLKRMKITRNNQSPSDQLKTHVFEQVFASYTADEQLVLIGQMNNCKTITDAYSFKLKFLVFRVQSAVANVLGNSAVQLVLAIVIAWQSRKIYVIAKAYFDRHFRTYYVPKAVNYFMSHAPIEAVRVASIFVRVVTYIGGNPIKVQLISWAVVTVAGPYSPHAEKIRKVMLLPISIPRWLLGLGPWSIFFKAFSVSNTVQGELSNLSKKSSEESKSKVIAEGAPKAYQLWMHLMKNPEDLYVK